MEQASQQRRGRRISMTQAEQNDFLSVQRTCRVATMSLDGPHAAPMWFFWDGASVWLNSLVRSQRWSDLQRDPRIAVVVDDGDEYVDLRGVELRGEVVVVGEAPRVGADVPVLAAAEEGFHRKYRDAKAPLVHDGRHAWLRLDPRKVISWDFRKIGPTGRQSS